MNISLFFKNVLFAVMLMVATTNINAQKVSKLFDQGNINKAKEYCEKQKGEKQKQCYTELAELFFNAININEAGNAYAKSADPEYGYLKIAEYYFDAEKYNSAKNYYNKTSKADYGYKKIGDVFLSQRKYDMAWFYYKNMKNYQECLYNMASTYINNKEWGRLIYKLKFSSFSNEEYKKLGDLHFEKLFYKGALDFYLKADLEQAEFIALGDTVWESIYPDQAASYYGAILNEEEVVLKIAQKRIELANEQLANKNYSHASTNYRLAYQNDSIKSQETMFLIAETCLKNGSSMYTASIYYAKGIADNPGVDKSIIKKVADHYFSAKYYDKAIDYYAMLNDNNQIRNAKSMKAASFLVNEDFQTAMQIYNEINEPDKAHECLMLSLALQIQNGIYPVIGEFNQKKENAGQDFFDLMVALDSEHKSKIVLEAMQIASDTLTAQYDRAFAPFYNNGNLNFRRASERQIYALKYKDYTIYLLSWIRQNYTLFITELKIDTLLQKLEGRDITQ